MLKNVKKYLFKLNCNQRANYQFKIFKTIFIRNVIDIIRKTSLIMIITSIIRVILIVEAIFISVIKSKQKIAFKKSMYYNCDKVGYYKKDYIIQDQIELNFFF